MSMLVKGGLIHTMTEQGSFVGDILIQGDRIAAVAPEIELDDAANCVLEAKGLTILPGLVDAHIQQTPASEDDVLSQPQAVGVTAGLLWPEEDGCCPILTQGERTPSGLYRLTHEKYTDAQLHARFLTLAENGFRPACGIRSPEECRRVLAAVHSSRVKAILIHLTGCEALLEAISLSGCPVVMGVGSFRSSPWAVIRQLDALNVPVSVTCNYPDAKLCHLPLCASLCVREGMDRERALRTITTAPGVLLGLSGAGLIAPSARADLVIYDGDPLLLATSHVMTISGGKIRH